MNRKAVIFGIKGTKLSAKEKKFLKKTKPWGIILFSRKLEINMNELEENIKNKNIDKEKKEEMIRIEKIKKINIISNTFYNEIKRKYLIKNIQ